MNRKQGIGCLAVVVALVGGVLGVSFLLREDKSPCDRYVEVVVRARENCHSGQTRDRDHHRRMCHERANPTDACLERIEKLTCDEVERELPGVAGPVCLK
jgi:hypothetical protein